MFGPPRRSPQFLTQPSTLGGWTLFKNEGWGPLGLMFGHTPPLKRISK